MDYQKIPLELRKRKRWVCSRKDSKIPFETTCRFPAKTTNPNTWSWFEDAVSSVFAKYYDYIGFVFAPGDSYVGIDIDKGFTDSGEYSDISLDALSACPSFAEKSKSGRGIHIICKGHLPKALKNETAGIEMYSEGRYFIMTGDAIALPVIVETQEGIDYLFNKYQNQPTNRKEPTDIRLRKNYYPEWPLPGKRIPLRPIYPKVGKGGRNNAMASLAGHLHMVGYSGIQILGELTYANEIACDPPLTKRELENIVSSICKYERRYLNDKWTNLKT